MADTATASAAIKLWFETGDIPTQQQFADFITSYPNLVDNNQLDNIETGITAHAGGGQGSAYQITKRFSSVGTVATALDSVKLPTGATSKAVIIRNSAANAVNIFPQSGAFISKLGLNTALTLPQYCIAFFTCTDGTNWEVNVLQEFSSASNPVLFTGTGSPLALAVNQSNNFVSDGLVGATTFDAPTGLVGNGQRISLMIRDNGTARALTWNSAFSATFNALPSTTVANKWLFLTFQWSGTDAKWLLLSSTLQSLYPSQAKVYRAILNQSGTSAPTATVLENTLGGTPTYARAGTGSYEVTLSLAFASAKTHILINNPAIDVPCITQAICAPPNQIVIETYDDSFTPADDILTDTAIQILVYP